MKKRKILLPLIIASQILCSCGNTDSTKRNIFLAAKYKLSSAIFNNDYVLNMEPAYFNNIKSDGSCIQYFDKDSSFIDYNVKVQNGVPVGYGSYSFQLLTGECYACNYFEYVCVYDMVYGGSISQTSNYKSDIMEYEYCRVRYWWVRAILRIPEIEDGRRIVAEFTVSETHEEPTDFDLELY